MKLKKRRKSKSFLFLSNGNLILQSLLLFAVQIEIAECFNWVQTAGELAQTNVIPQIPSINRPIFTSRWGHSTVVVNQTDLYRNDLSIEENSKRVESLTPKLILLGGDDYTKDEDSDTFGGLRNDVWSMDLPSKASDWRLNPKIEKITSTLQWELVNKGHEPPLNQSFDDWIACQEYFGESRDAKCLDPEVNTNVEENMWSPRRGHASIVFRDEIYVIGGRVRDFEPVKGDQLVGGYHGNRYEANKSLESYRKSVSFRNDVWKSSDGGKSWSLVTLGCTDHQEDILLRTETWTDVNVHNSSSTESYTGSIGSVCQTSNDCYGDAVCKEVNGSANKVCVCPMFSGREHHSLSVQHRYFEKEDGTIYSDDYLYLVGGFTNVRHDTCGDFACGNKGSYRVALDDIWVTNDGKHWVQIREATSEKGDDGYYARGAHSSVMVQANKFRERNADKLWILGGEFVDAQNDISLFLNDIWSIHLETKPCCAYTNDCGDKVKPLTLLSNQTCLPTIANWTKEYHGTNHWTPRSGQVAVYEPPSSRNAFVDSIYIIGGKNSTSFHSDVWSLDLIENNVWKKDFDKITNQESVPIAVNGRGGLKANAHQFYYDSSTQLSKQTRPFLPLFPKEDEDMVAISPLVFPIIDENDLMTLKENGIHTFSDLALANQRTILRLRGYDYPGINPKTVKDVCYLRRLVQLFLDKCSVKKHFRDRKICKGSEFQQNCIEKEWDGCSPVEGYSYIDIHGIGDVEIPQKEPSFLEDLETMFCKQTIGERFMSSGEFVGSKLFLMGGKGQETDSSRYSNVWFRDNTFPKAYFAKKPKSKTSQSKFRFECNDDGVVFEYKIVDYSERLDVTPWMLVQKDEEVDISWLDSKKGGPGSGWYSIYVRAVKPSGNRDISYSSNNTYTWFYIQPLPWGKIFLFIALALFAAAAAVFEYRRREKRAALERYAKRERERRFKIKSMGTDGDWRQFYEKQALSSKKQFSSTRNLSTERSELRAKRRDRRSKREEKLLLLQGNDSDEDQVEDIPRRRRPKFKIR
ncbi:hypothetical protein CTEN210_16142 [Chaetoceros tenuissimus]|uniref:Uncharacterized protein n=1 Tax=Chaetoceros tenuissimus TaxID=426638 RepID=A0AAD3D880_9STRA|nr:hypothetical protein CTEN210_16142 [Chaetoceros tenuissimus]